MEEEIKRALECLKKGGVIAYPTDTIWGLGCDATNEEAVSRLLDLKKRDGKPLLLLVADLAQLERTVESIPEAAEQLIDVAVDPLTIIYDHARPGIAPECLGSDGSVGVRVTSDNFCQALCRRLRAPLVSTSANFSGKPSPKCFADIDPELLQKADYVVDWRRDEPEGAKPSGIIKVSDGNVFKVIR